MEMTVYPAYNTVYYNFNSINTLVIHVSLQIDLRSKPN